MANPDTPAPPDKQADATGNEYSAAYSESGFWAKLKSYAATAGREVVEKALLLYYAAQEEKAPAWAKATIVGALGYFITPLDAVVDLTPGVGYVDDLGVLALAVAAVAAYINDDVRAKARAKMGEWFGTSNEGSLEQSSTTSAEGASRATEHDEKESPEIANKD
ncbi:MAG: hypothetical protein Hals2KO_04350 [Halioglobus sp.]